MSLSITTTPSRWRKARAPRLMSNFSPAIGWQSKLAPRYGQCYDGKWDWRVGVEAKQQMLKAVEEFPDGAGVEEGLDRLYLLYKVENDVKTTMIYTYVLNRGDRGVKSAADDL